MPFSDGMQVLLAGQAAKIPYMTETFKKRMKRLRLRAGLSSQQKAADVIGCDRGAVSMWEAPSSPVNSVGGEYLLSVAAAYKVHPAYINTGEGDDGFPMDALEAQDSHSQLVRLDHDMIAETHRALRELYHENGRVFSIEEDSARFVQVYQLRAGMSKQPSQDEWIKFGRKLAVMAPQGATRDGRDDGVPTKGADQGSKSRGIRRKA